VELINNMPQLVIPKSYKALRSPRASDIDNIRLTVENFVNGIKLDSDNLQVDALAQAFSTTQAAEILDRSELGDIVDYSTNIIVQETGIYLIKLPSPPGVALGPNLPPSPTTTIGSTFSFIIRINGVVNFSAPIVNNYTVSGSNIRSIEVSSTGDFIFPLFLTEGDVLTEDSGVEIKLIKLLRS